MSKKQHVSPGSSHSDFKLNMRLIMMGGNSLKMRTRIQKNILRVHSCVCCIINYEILIWIHKIPFMVQIGRTDFGFCQKWCERFQFDPMFCSHRTTSALNINMIWCSRVWMFQEALTTSANFYLYRWFQQNSIENNYYHESIFIVNNIFLEKKTRLFLWSYPHDLKTCM